MTIKWSQTTVNKWFADDGNNTHRLGHDLNRGSLVFDVGGFTGEGAQKICDKFGCTIYSFEPVPRFYEKLKKRFLDNEDVIVFPYGLGPENKILKIADTDDATSILSTGNVEIRIVDIADFFWMEGIDRVDLMEINIEGAEYDLLDYMLDKKLVDRIDNLTIQFHDVIPDAAMRMKNIQRRLMETHELTYQYTFVFENWQKK